MTSTEVVARHLTPPESFATEEWFIVHARMFGRWADRKRRSALAERGGCG